MAGHVLVHDSMRRTCQCQASVSTTPDPVHVRHMTSCAYVACDQEWHVALLPECMFVHLHLPTCMFLHLHLSTHVRTPATPTCMHVHLHSPTCMRVHVPCTRLLHQAVSRAWHCWADFLISVMAVREREHLLLRLRWLKGLCGHLGGHTEKACG